MQCKNKIQLRQGEFEIHLYFNDNVEEDRASVLFGKYRVTVTKLEVHACIRSQKRLSKQIMRSLY